MGINKTEDIGINKTTDMGISKTENIGISKTEDVDNTKNEDNDEDRDKGRNKHIQMFRFLKRWKDKKGNQKKRSIVWAFWDDNHIPELCEKWVYYNGNYAYTRFEGLRKRSDEVLFTREYKATTSKYNSNAYIDIDELQVFKDFSIKGKTATKTKDMLAKINSKISAINKAGEVLAKIKVDATKKLSLIYEVMGE